MFTLQFVSNQEPNVDVIKIRNISENGVGQDAENVVNRENFI